MSKDGLFELDQSCWVALAKYNLLLATVFGGITVGVRTMQPASTLLIIENGVFALVFGAIQTYAWLTA